MSLKKRKIKMVKRLKTLRPIKLETKKPGLYKTRLFSIKVECR